MSAAFSFSNFAQSSLAYAIGAEDTSLSAVKPDIFPEGTFTAVLWNAAFSSPAEDSGRELILAVKAGGTFNIVRGQESTLPKSWEAGTRVANVISAQAMNSIFASLAADGITTVTQQNYQMSAADKKLAFRCENGITAITAVLPEASVCEGSEFILINISDDKASTVTFQPQGSDTLALTEGRLVIAAGSHAKVLCTGGTWHVISPVGNSRSELFAFYGLADVTVFPPEISAYVTPHMSLDKVTVNAVDSTTIVAPDFSGCPTGKELTIIRNDSSEYQMWVSITGDYGMIPLTKQGDSVTVAYLGGGTLRPVSICRPPENSVVWVTETAYLLPGISLVTADAGQNGEDIYIYTPFPNECTGQTVSAFKTDTSEHNVIVTFSGDEYTEVVLSVASPKCMFISNGTNWLRLV